MLVEVKVGLQEALTHFADHPEGSSCLTVKFAGGSNVECLNAALDRMNEISQARFVAEFLRAWDGCMGADSPYHKTIAAVYGEPHPSLCSNRLLVAVSLGCPLMFTLSRDETRLRCWYGVPSSFGNQGTEDEDFVSGLLFSISCPEEAMKRLLADIRPLGQTADLKNGRIWLAI